MSTTSVNGADSPAGFARKLPLILALASIAAGLALEFTVLRGYASHWWNEVPAFYLLWGAAGSALLLAVASLGARALVRTRTEDDHE